MDYDPADAYDIQDNTFRYNMPYGMYSNMNAPMAGGIPFKPPPPPGPPPASSLPPVPPPPPEILPPPPPPPDEDQPPPPPPEISDTDSMSINLISKNENPLQMLERLNTERVERERRIAQENIKSKQTSIKHSVLLSKRIIGFHQEDEDDEMSRLRRQAQMNNGEDSNEQVDESSAFGKRVRPTENNTAYNSNQITDTTTNYNNELSTETLTTITKTATWILENPDKANLLIEKSRGNDKMSFLFDRHSIAGQKYLEEYSRIKAEKSVQDIYRVTTHDTSSSMIMPSLGNNSVLGLGNNTVSQMPSVSNDAAERAKRAASLFTAKFFQQQQQQQQQSQPQIQFQPQIPSSVSSYTPSLPTTNIAQSSAFMSTTTSIPNSTSSSTMISSSSAVASSTSIALSLAMLKQKALMKAQSSQSAETSLILTHQGTTSSVHSSTVQESNPPVTLTSVVEHKDECITVQQADQAAEKKSRKRNRWGTSQEASTAAATITDIISISNATQPTTSSSLHTQKSIAADLNNQIDADNLLYPETVDQMSETERIRWEKQIQEQKEMQLLESRIRHAAKMSLPYLLSSSSSSSMSESAVSQSTVGDGNAEIPMTKEEILYQERLREYQELAAKYNENDTKDTYEDAENNNGIIDGGTWEHRKRAKEMLQTAEKNLYLTARASGRHHMSDFLPIEELNKFLKKAEALKSGTFVSERNTGNTYEEHKISSDNIGYQLLMKAGWSENTSLGVQGNNATTTSTTTTSDTSAGTERLIEPLGIYGHNSSDHTAGLGGSDSNNKPTYELEMNDDEYDQYRKRMMLAYRFRPNPMNNPRRNYY